MCEINFEMTNVIKLVKDTKCLSMLAIILKGNCVFSYNANILGQYA